MLNAIIDTTKLWPLGIMYYDIITENFSMIHSYFFYYY